MTSVWRYPLVLAAWCAPLAAAAGATELFTCPALPREAEPFRLVCRLSAETGARTARIRLLAADGTVVAQRSCPLVEDAGGLQASMDLSIPGNGMYRAEARVGGALAEAPVAVISAKREVNLVYYGMDSRLLREGYVRWVTLVTACDEGTAGELSRRGARALAWNWGGNLLGEKRKQLEATGGEVTPEAARQLSRDLYVSGAAEAIAKGYAGFGLDEFGDYPGSANSAATAAFVRGIIDARRELPEGFVLAAWHAGAIGPELMGLYKQAVEYLLLESYLLDIVPSQLGTELLAKDLEGRLADARAADMFTAPYGSRCRVLATVEVMDGVPVGEYEAFFRLLRREFPEVRGIGFFNVLAEPNWGTYRTIDALCLDYFVKPVLTFQPDSLSHDRLGTGRVIAQLSNIGAMDSGPVTVRLLVDGTEVDRVTLTTVPVGYSRVDNRAAAVFDWSPTRTGTRSLRAEIVSARGSTVLEPATNASVYFDP